MISRYKGCDDARNCHRAECGCSDRAGVVGGSGDCSIAEWQQGSLAAVMRWVCSRLDHNPCSQMVAAKPSAIQTREPRSARRSRADGEIAFSRRAKTSQRPPQCAPGRVSMSLLETPPGHQPQRGEHPHAIRVRLDRFVLEPRSMAAGPVTNGVLRCTRGSDTRRDCVNLSAPQEESKLGSSRCFRVFLSASMT